MQQDFPRESPQILYSHDIAIMKEAVRIALGQTDCDYTQDHPDALARTVMSLYRLGLLEPEKLASTAAMLTASKLFRNCRDLVA